MTRHPNRRGGDTEKALVAEPLDVKHDGSQTLLDFILGNTLYNPFQ